MRELVVGVSTAAMIGGVALTLVQGGALREIVRLASGLTMLLALLTPLSALRLPSAGGWLQGTFAQASTRTEAEQMQARNDELAVGSMARAAASYIEEQAKVLGVRCTAKVTLGQDARGTLTLDAVTVTYHAADSAALNTVRQMIENECGIPQERQSYVEGQI